MMVVFPTGEKVKNFTRLIHFYIANGIVDSNAIAKRLIENHGYADPENPNMTYKIVEEIFSSCLAQSGAGFINKRKNPHNYFFIPATSPDKIAARDYQPKPKIKPKVVKRVRFTYWDGDNAPEVSNWTGEIIRKWNEGSIIKFEIKRDYDGNIIILTYPYIYSYT